MILGSTASRKEIYNKAFRVKNTFRGSQGAIAYQLGRGGLEQKPGFLDPTAGHPVALRCQDIHFDTPGNGSLGSQHLGTIDRSAS
jgi:hypothetical protein